MAATATTERPPPKARTDPTAWPVHDVAGGGLQRLLDLDPALGRRLAPDVAQRLTPALRVDVAELGVGTYRASALPQAPGTLGLLVIDGLLLRDVAVHGRRCAELLGPGDLLRPWPDPDGAAGALGAADASWHVVGEAGASLAVIDRRASLLIGRFPELMAELLDRTLRRARALQLQLALTQVNGIGQRLELLFWHLADRWGRVTPGGVVVPLDLTHEMLGRLVGARRPSVTTALCRLRDGGVVERQLDGWLLHGDPVANVASLSDDGPHR